MRSGYSYKPHINQIVGKYFVKMIRMNTLISGVYSGSDATCINFVIDLYSIKNSLLGTDFSYENDNDLCALILDMITHYKNYFNGIGVAVNFLLINSNNLPIKTKIVYPNYNCEYAMKLSAGNTAYIDKNYEYLNIISQYIPDVYYVSTTSEAAVAVFDLIDGQTIPTIILSKDPYWILLVEQNPNVSWIRPKKSNMEDASKICHCNIVNAFLCYDVFGVNYTPINVPIGLDIVIACTKFPARSMEPILQYRTLASMINNCDDCMNIRWDSNEISKRAGLNVDIENRRVALDLPLQLDLYRQTAECAINRNIPPKSYDIEGLKHLNNEYFSANPLRLDDLLR